MKASLLFLLLVLLGSAAVGAAADSAPTPKRPVLSRTEPVTRVLKRLAEGMRDKNATVQGICALVGPVKEDWGDYYELTPNSLDFSEASVAVALYHGVSHLPLGERKPDTLDLTLTHRVVLTLGDLARTFGKWHSIPINPDGGTYHVVFTYPNSRASLSIAIFADLTGQPQNKAVYVQKITFRRDDARDNT